MARPKKKGLDYFPLDVDIFQDEKWVCMSGEYGFKAEAFLMRLLCIIYRNGYFITWSKPIRYKLTKDVGCGVTPEELDQMLESAIEIGLFDAELFRNHGVITSQGIQRRYFEAVGRRVALSETPYKLIDCQSSTKSPESPGKITSPKEVVKEDSKPSAEVMIADESSTSKITDFSNELKANSTWKYYLIKRYHSSDAEINAKIDEFQIHCQNMQSNHESINEAQRHFSSWMNKKYPSTAAINLKYPISNDIKHDDKFSRRRGFEPDDWSKVEYSETL